MTTLADGFTIAELTDAVNAMPFAPGVIGELGLFNARGARSRNMTIDSRDGVLTLIGATEPGAPGQQYAGGKGRTFVIRAPRHRLEATIHAASLADARAFGSEAQAGVAEAIEYQQLQMTASADLTVEHALLGAVRGSVVDGQSGEELYNLYDAQGVTARSAVDLDLDNASADLEGKFDEIRLDAIEDGRGFVNAQTPFVALYGRDAWAGFKGHSKVRGAWERFQDGAWLRDRKAAFELWGVRHIEYVTGSGVGLADDEVRVLPMSSGPASLYQLRYAPAETFDAIGGEGLPRYSWVDEETRDRIKLILETNPVAFCRAPRVLRAATA